MVQGSDTASAKLPILLLTSDKYSHVVPAFAHLFNKYWGKEYPVTVCGFTDPKQDLPENFSFYSIGDFSQYPVERWSDALIRLLNDTPHEVFALMLEDYWLTRPVNTRAVDILYDYAKQFHFVLKIDLCADRLYAAGSEDYDTVSYLDLVRSDPKSQYHMSLLTGIWRRENLLKFLVPGETPWEVEIEGTPRVRAAGTDILVLGTRQWPVRHTLAFRSGDPTVLKLDDMKECDVRELRDLGLID